MQYATTIATTAPHPATMELWQYGVLGLACAMLVGAVIYLYKDGRKRDRQHLAARKAWDDERASLLVEQARQRGEAEAKLAEARGDFAEKCRELSNTFAAELRKDRDSSRQHEDGTRREFAELMEKIADKNAASMAAVNAVLAKYYNRFVDQRGRY